MSQKVKSNFSFGLSHGLVRSFGSAWAEPLAQSKVQTEPRLRPNLIWTYRLSPLGLTWQRWLNPLELNFGWAENYLTFWLRPNTNLRSGLKPELSSQISVWSQPKGSDMDLAKKWSHPLCSEVTSSTVNWWSLAPTKLFGSVKIKVYYGWHFWQHAVHFSSWYGHINNLSVIYWF